MPAQTMRDPALVGVPWQVVGISGTSWTALEATVKHRVDTLALAYERTVLVLTGGTSDIYNVHDNDTGAKALADMEAYADARRAAGWDYIIAATITPSSLLDADDEAQRLTLNDGIRASAKWDAVVDFAAIPELMDRMDAAYYYDQTHWNDAGAALAAAALRPLILDAL